MQTRNAKSRRFSSTEWLILGINVVYLTISLIASIGTQNREFILYVIVTTVLLSLILAAHCVVRFHVMTLAGLTLWGISHMAGGLLRVPESWPIDGEMRVLYNAWLVPKYLKFDQLVHACGFGIVTWMCWQGLERAFAKRQVHLEPSYGLLTLCIAAGNGFGALNEVVEFIATLTLPKTNVGGYVNTGWDLVFNLVGSVAAAMFIRALSPRANPIKPPSIGGQK